MRNEGINIKEEKAFTVGLWGKKGIVNGQFKWLPLKQHLIDTMMVSRLLWEHWLSPGQRREIIDDIQGADEDKAKQLVGFLGAIHDFAKATPVFQSSKSFILSYSDLEEILFQKLEEEGFRGIKELDLTSKNQSHHSLGSQVLLHLYGIQDDIGSIVGAHHGRIVKNKESVTSQLQAYGANYFQKENSEDSIHKKWKKEQEKVLMWALEENGFYSVKELPSIEKRGQILLSALLIMSDWIASNEEYFPLLDVEDHGENVDQKDRLEKGWHKWFKTFVWLPESIKDIHHFYENRFGFKNPKAIQKDLAKIIENTEEPGIFIVEAPMGIGKTEAALAAVEQLCAKTGRSGMFFGLPTQATSNGVFNRIKAWIGHLIQEDKESKSLQLVHGKAALNQEFTSLAKNIDSDGGEEAEILANQWFSGRKTALLDDFVVGTVDHFLLSAFKKKHLALRHLGFSKKVVVIDEVHSYDAFSSVYLCRAIHWMGFYHIPVVLLSATLPSKYRIAFMEAYAGGTGKKIKNMIHPKNWDSTQAYPLITYSDGDQFKQFEGNSPPEIIEVTITKIKEEDLVFLLNEGLKERGIVGIVVNTVRRAQNLAKVLSEIFGQEKIELLHSSFISTHRSEKEQNLLKTIGKTGDRPYNRIIIGTQVIEQSLDIDFDVMISDLAPMDLLIQRMGRLHRHDRTNRPPNFKSPSFYVMGCSDELQFEKGSSCVYGDYLLIRTQHYLPNQLQLPKDISVLVQKVYDNKDILLEENLQAIYLQAKEDMEKKEEDKIGRAKAYLLEEPKKSKIKKESLIGWLINPDPHSSDQKGLAQVRDTQESIEVILVKKRKEGYSFIGEEENIANRIEEFEIGKKLATQTLKLPNAFSASYSIDKTIEILEKENQEYFSQWQQQVWLKGALGIQLDENDSYELNGWKLHYSHQYGLEYEKVVENENI